MKSQQNLWLLERARGLSLAGLVSFLVWSTGCDPSAPSPETSTPAPQASSATPETATTETTKPASMSVVDLNSKEAATRLQNDSSIQVLDVRRPDEYSAGHIQGAKNINFMDDGFKAGLEGLDRNTTYLMHCAAGGRSARALETFKELGFTSILHMTDGMNGWIDSGLPVEK